MDRRQFLKYAVTTTAIVGASAIGLNYVLSPNRFSSRAKVDNTTGWVDGQALPFGIADAPAVSYGTRLFVFGGYSRTVKDYRNSVLEFDGHVWTLKSPMPIPCWGPAATIHDDNAYVFGGYPNATAQLYRITSDEWTLLVPCLTLSKVKD